MAMKIPHTVGENKKKRKDGPFIESPQSKRRGFNNSPKHDSSILSSQQQTQANSNNCFQLAPDLRKIAIFAQLLNKKNVLLGEIELILHQKQTVKVFKILNSILFKL